jgi:hypothetical protein
VTKELHKEKHPLEKKRKKRKNKKKQRKNTPNRPNPTPASSRK